MRLVIAVMAFCLPLIPNPASAQQEKGKEAATTEQKPALAYRIEFNVREIEDGKRLNSRNYMMVLEDGSNGRIRVGSDVAVPVGEKTQAKVELGMNIDCRPHARENSVALDFSLESTNVVTSEKPIIGTIQPAFRRQRSNISSLVTPGKPTLVASMDDVESNRRYEIEVTATKVK
jgi:hypothetical protein